MAKEEKFNWINTKPLLACQYTRGRFTRQIRSQGKKVFDLWHKGRTFLILSGVLQIVNKVSKSRKQRQRKIENTWLSTVEEAGLKRDVNSRTPRQQLCSATNRTPISLPSKVWGITWKEEETEFKTQTTGRRALRSSGSGGLLNSWGSLQARTR